MNRIVGALVGVFLTTVVEMPTALAQVATAGGVLKGVSPDGTEITVTLGSGVRAKDQRFRVSARTQVTLDDKRIKLGELSPGTKVTVTYDKSSRLITRIRARSAAPEAPDQTGTSDTPSKDARKKDTAKPVWTMDLSKMRIPDAPATGRIHGEDFTAEQAELEGGILTLREGKDFFPEKAVKLFLFLKEGESVEGKTFRVTGKERFRSPHVHVQWRAKKGEGVPETETVMDNYAMVLEFGKIKDSRLPGRIYLCLPNTTKSFVAGTFVVGEGSDKDEAGLGAEIFGTISIQGVQKGARIEVGCLGRSPEGKLEGPGVSLELGGSGRWATSTTWKPRNSTLAQDEKGRLTHKHVNRPLGKYLVYCRSTTVASDGTVQHEGYYDWKWVQIKDVKSKVPVDLTIDPSNSGMVEVTVDGPTKESSVTYLPLDEEGQLPLPEAHAYVSVSGAKLEGGKAIIRGLREGKYQVAMGPWQPGTRLPSVKATVEVKRGSTTKVQLVMMPDLQVSRVYLKEGYMRALVKNSGSARAEKVDVVFLVDAKPESKYGPIPLNVGQEAEASSQRLPPGTHVVKVVVDPDNEIREWDETNNAKEATLSSPR
ncbi:MAG: hypothetical protein HY000_13830 [Planctomycetes bacterium]|nr:hypothetical protein [Planctomycetota bacterium]